MDLSSLRAPNYGSSIVDTLQGNINDGSIPYGSIYDPNGLFYEPGGGGSGGGTSTPAVDLSQYDQGIGQVNAGLGRLGAQLNSGNSNIDTSYQNALNQLLQGKNTGERNYNTAKQTSATNYVGAKNTIGAQAGNALNGLLRLLGSRGAGGGSAATGQGAGTARGEVARGASLQRADVSNAFGANNQALDTNWGDYLQGYNNQVASAGSQRDQQKQSLQGTIDTNRATLLNSLAQLQAQRAQAAGGNGVTAAQPYLDQANQALDRVANYQTAPINYQTQAYTPPSLASYNTTPQPTAQFNSQGTNDYFSPFLQALLGKKQIA